MTSLTCCRLLSRLAALPHNACIPHRSVSRFTIQRNLICRELTPSVLNRFKKVEQQAVCYSKEQRKVSTEQQKVSTKQQKVSTEQQTGDGQDVKTELPTHEQELGDIDVLYSEIQLEVCGHDPSVLDSYTFFATEAANLLDIPNQSKRLATAIDKRTLVKSRHTYGKYHKVQYETRTFYRVITLSRLTGSTADTYLEYVQRNLPEGVAMKVTRTRLEPLPEHITRPEQEQL